MSTQRYPMLYQVNTRVWLTELSRTLGRRATLDDIPDAALDQFAQQGFDWIWLLSVWQTGLAAQLVSRSNPVWRRVVRLEFIVQWECWCSAQVAKKEAGLRKTAWRLLLGGSLRLCGLCVE